MSAIPSRRLAGAVAITVLVLGLAACSSGSGSGADSTEDVALITPAEAVLASYTGLEAQSYTMEMVMTVNGLDFMNSTNVVEGESSRVSQDLYMSAILEVSGEEFPDDPEMAEMMNTMFSDVHSETVLVDGTIYMQISSGAFDMSEEFGEDAWFTLDIADHTDLQQVYDQVGGLDLAEQTELLLTDISDVEETGDGVYTGTLSADSEAMESMLGATGATEAAAGQEPLEAAEVVITVDGDGLLKTMEMTFPEVEGITMHMVSEVVEIGGDYDIAAPESDNLHSFDELAGATP